MMAKHGKHRCVRRSRSAHQHDTDDRAFNLDP